MKEKVACVGSVPYTGFIVSPQEILKFVIKVCIIPQTLLRIVL